MQTKQSIDEHAARNFIWSRKKVRARSSFTTFASLDEIGNYLRARTDTCSALIHSNDSPSFIHSSFWCFFLLDSFSFENFSMLIVTDGIFILSNSFALLYGY